MHRLARMRATFGCRATSRPDGRSLGLKCSRARLPMVVAGGWMPECGRRPHLHDRGPREVPSALLLVHVPCRQLPCWWSISVAINAGPPRATALPYPYME